MLFEEKHCIKIREVFTEQMEEKGRTIGEAVLSLFLYSAGNIVAKTKTLLNSLYWF